MNVNLFKRTAVGLAVAAAAVGSAHGYEVSINVAGIESRGAFGDAGNETRVISLFEGVRITGLAWNVDLSTVGSSWLSEMSVDFSDDSGLGVALSPGFGDDADGTASYIDSFDLEAAGLDFRIGASGNLNLQFFETFDDFVGATDGNWLRGTITVTFVPEPATFGLAAVALLGLGAASRRKQPRQA